VKGSRLVAVLAALVLAAGCATVPTSGSVRSGNQAGAGPSQFGVGVLADPPKPGADPRAIVNGFIEAMSNSLSFDTAKTYLTPQAAAQWRPDSRTSIYERAVIQEVEDSSDLVLAGQLIATLDARSAWQTAPPDTPFRFVFKLTKVAGEFRIAKAPDGVLLDKNLRETNYDTRNLYFVTPARDLLVPDPIYVPLTRTSSQVAKLLMEALLAGPTDRLGDAVWTAAPPGTQLNSAVTVDSGVANVDLSDEVAGLGAVDRELLAAQITWTLRSVASTVRITVSGAPLLEGGSEERSFNDFAKYDPSVPTGTLTQLFVLKDGKINTVNGLDGSSQITTEPLADSLLSGYWAKSFAISLRSELGAIVTGNQLVVARLESDGNDKENKWDTSGVVTRPSFDWQGNLWWVERANSSTPRVMMRDADGKKNSVKANFGGRQVTTLRVAPDGVRVLATVSDGAKSSVLIGRITIGENGARSMDGFRSLELPLRDIIDASWSKPDRVTVVGKSGKSTQRQPWEVNVDGSLPALVAGLSEVDVHAIATSVNLETLLVVRDKKGGLQRRSRDLQWENPLQEAAAVYYPVYPG